MAVRGSAVHKNHNPTPYITELSPINHFFIMVAYPGHILFSLLVSTLTTLSYLEFQ